MAAAALARRLFSGATKRLGAPGDAAQSLFTGARGADILADPSVMGPVAAAGAGFGVAEIGQPLASSFVESMGLEERERGFTDYVKDQRVGRTLRSVEMDRLRKAMLQSASRLAALDPQLYNQVLAGRRLPQGAVVFGGQPRVDLLEQLAYEMASGGYNEPNAQDDLSALLGA